MSNDTEDATEPPYTFEWHYAPRSFFEGPVEFEGDGAKFTADDGVARAVIPSSGMQDIRSRRDRFHELLKQRFLVRQLISSQNFELPQPGLSRRWADGRCDAYLFVESAVHISTSGQLDLVVKDNDGNVIRDTKRDRMAREGRLAALVAKHGTDPTVTKLLASRQAGSQDAANELVHLAEIEEAMSTYFGGDAKAKLALSLSTPQWKALTKPANDPTNPVGRHRGRHLGEMRRSSRTELEEARRVSTLMIERFLEYLDRQ